MAISETITVDAGPAIDQLKALSDAADRAAAAMERIGKASAGGGGADKLAASMSAAADRIEQASQRAAASMGRLSTAARSATGGLDTVGASADKAAAGEDKVAGSADAAAASLDRQAAAGERAGRSGEAAAAGGTKFWGGLKTVLLGAGVAAAYGIDKAMKFQSEMLLLHTQAGVSMKDTQTMSQGVLQISTQTGQSLTDVAESAYHVASNMESMKGSSPAKMLEAVKIAAEGAAVGHSNLVDTTNAMTAAIASNIPGVKNYSQAMGVLNATVGSGDMKMQDLADAFGGGMVAVVKGYGLSLKDVGAALATFGDNNIRGAKAGTDLRMAVQALAVPLKTAPLKEFGLSAETLAKDMQQGGLNKALLDLTNRFHQAGLTGKTEGQAITDLFGKKAGAGVAVLLEQMDRLESKYPQLTKNANNFNAAWQATQASPAQKWKELTAGLQAGAVGFGTALLPAFTVAVGGADKLLAAINGSKSGARDIAVAFGGIAALFTAKKLTSGIESAFQTAQAGLRITGKVAQVLNIPGLSKLANIGQSAGLDGAAAKLGGAGASLDGAAASLEGAAATLKEGGSLPGVLPGGKAGAAGEGAVAAEDAAAAGIGSKIASGIGKSIGPMIAVALADAVLHSIPSGPGGKNWFDNPFGMPGPTSKASSHNWLTSFSPYERLFSKGGSQISQMFADPWDAIFGTAPKPGKDWTSVLGGSATYGRLPPPPPSSAPQSPAGIQQSGAPSTAYAGRFGPTTGAAPAQAAAPAAQPMDMIGGAGRPGTVQVPAPLTTGLDAAKAKVQADITAINSVMSGMKAKGVKIPAPDLSAMDTAKAKLQADLKGIDTELSKVTGKPSKIGAPDLSALDTAKAKAVADAGQIMQGLQTALQKTVKASAPDISAFRGAIGPAAADGQAISAGLASGIQAGEGAAVAAAHAVAAAVTAALNISLQVKSPSKVTQKIGAATVEGLIVGLQGGQPALTAAATALGQITAKAADVSAIDAAITKAIGYAGKDSALVTWLKGEQSKLTALAAKRTQLETEITDSTQIATSAVSGASLMNAGAYTPALANGPQSAQTTITGMQYMAGDQTSFAQHLQQLQKQGLNATSLSQLAQSGAQAGLPVAEGLTQGGKGAIAQANALEKIVMKGSAAVGDVGGPAMYQAGVQLGQMAASGLKSQLSAVDAAMKQIGQAIVADLDKALHIKPPASGGGGGSAAHKAHEAHEIHVHVHLDGREIATSTQTAVLALQANNWQSGLVLPGRRP